MTKEIFPELYSSFFHEMSQLDSLNESAQKAFEVLEDALHIGLVTVSFSPRKNGYASLQRNLPTRIELYRSKAGTNQDLYQNYQFTLQEQIIVEISIYADLHCEQWSPTHLKSLALIAETTYVFVSRLRFADLSASNAMTDTLTGLNNSIAFVNTGRQHCAQGDIGKYTGIQLNIKNFRLVNQRYGNVIGDQVLRKFGSQLNDLMKTGDTAARLGSDSFVLLVHDDEAADLIEQLENVTVTAINYDASEIPVELSCRMGVYEIPDDEQDFGHVMEAISNTLMASRTTAHTNVLYYSQQMVNSLLKKSEIESLFPKALKKHEFIAYYQPKVSLEDYSLIGCEALVRWKHDGQFIMPGDFIPILEEDTTVCQLDFYMLEQVCQDINDWLIRGFNPPIVSVNFSKHHLSNPNFVDQIMEIIDRYNVDTSYIEIELTETTGYDDFSHLKKCIAQMQAYGLTTSIDDFGTGYSSLNLLKDLSVDVIKIDKSFLSAKNTSYERDQIVIRNIIHMAHELGIDIITEGVETSEQAHLLKSFNCMMAQGFLFDKPLPKTDFEDRMMLGQYPDPEA
jgi:diguanylate cyclase (GGDEF)-like protein